MIRKQITQTADGVDIRFSGAIEKARLETMASGCNGGGAACSCECGSGLKEQIERVEVLGTDGDVTLSLKGQGLDALRVGDAMDACDMERFL